MLTLHFVKWHVPVTVVMVLGVVNLSVAQSANIDVAMVDRVVRSRGGKLVGYGPCPEYQSVVHFRGKSYCALMPSTTTSLVGVNHTDTCCQFATQAEIEKAKREVAQARRRAAVAERQTQRARAQAAAAMRTAYKAKMSKKNQFFDLKASTIFNGLMQGAQIYADVSKTRIKANAGLVKSLDEPEAAGDEQWGFEVPVAENSAPVSKDLQVETSPMAHLPVGEGAARLSVSTNRPDAVYKLGDAVEINLQVSKDSYITVFDSGSSGKVHMIFPNKYQKVNFVKAGGTVTIPGKKAGFDFIAAGPPGKDYITVIASSEPHDFTANSVMTSAGPFKSLDKDAEALAKDLQVEMQRPDMPKYAVSNTEIRIVAPQ